MDVRFLNYQSPLTSLAKVSNEGSFCTSEVQEITSKIEVDEWVTIDNEVSFD